MLKKNRRSFLIFIVGILISFIILLYGYNLYFPNRMYFDEVYHVKRAVQLVELNQYNFGYNHHPPLWALFSAAGISFWGNFSFVWRLPSLISGIIVILLLYLLTFKLTKDRITAFFAAFLMTFDCMSMVQARIGMLNSMMVMFMMLSLYCLFQYTIDKSWSRKKSFITGGIFYGAALAVKLVSCFFIIMFFAIVAAYLLKKKEWDIKVIRDFILYWCILPAVVFFGFHLFIPFMDGGSWSDIWLHVSFVYDGFTEEQGHLYGSRWWSWPLLIRPTWYVFEQENSIVKGILCMGNQAVFWMIPVSLGLTCWRFVKKRAFVEGFILLGLVSQWLPWAFIARVQFNHYFYTAMPFICISIAVPIARIWRQTPEDRYLIIFYLLFVIALFIYWYPLLNGMPISEKYYLHHMWFKSWV